MSRVGKIHARCECGGVAQGTVAVSIAHLPGCRFGVAQRLRAARRKLGLSQRELSEPGVSYAYISRIENGARSPSVKALRKLAAKLDVSARWLETGEDAVEVALPRGLLDRAVSLERERAETLESYMAGGADVSPVDCSNAASAAAEARRDLLAAAWSAALDASGESARLLDGEPTREETTR